MPLYVPSRRRTGLGGRKDFGGDVGTNAEEVGQSCRLRILVRVRNPLFYNTLLVARARASFPFVAYLGKVPIVSFSNPRFKR